MTMRIKQRIATLEATIGDQRRAKKRALPDWLQSAFEQAGYVFDAAGQITRNPDGFNSEHTSTAT